MTKTKLLALLTMITMAVGCGDSDEELNNYTDSYSLSYNGCSTGTHTFKAITQTELNYKVCTALLDDELNNHCAWQMRLEKAYSYCDDSVL